MVYMSVRTGSFLGLEKLDTIITIICSEMPFDGSSCLVETGQLVCIAGCLTGLCMIQYFAEDEF